MKLEKSEWYKIKITIYNFTIVVLLEAIIYYNKHKIFICMYSIHYTVETDYLEGIMQTYSIC